MNRTEVNDDLEFMLQKVVEAMQEKKAKKIVSLDLSHITNAITKYFIVCHASSKTQVRAIYDYILEKVKKDCGVNPYNKEGYENAEWILIDYVDIVVHIFFEEIRNFYRLEELWGDAIKINYDIEQ